MKQTDSLKHVNESTDPMQVPGQSGFLGIGVVVARIRGCAVGAGGLPL